MSMRNLWRRAVWLSLLSLLLLGACTFGRIVYYGNSEITDWMIFPKREMSASTEPFSFLPNTDNREFPTDVRLPDGNTADLFDFLQDNGTIAFLLIQDDVLLVEKYFQGYTADDPSLSFSTAKSITSLLVGRAIADKLIDSVDDSVTRYVPELKSNGFDVVKIRHLLQMTGGIDYTENDNPFGVHPAFYYGDDLEKRMLKFKLKEKPGTRFEYKSGETQLLGLVLKRALKSKTITEYMYETIWEPIGAENRAYWCTDREGVDGLEKTYCCFTATARDFAKIGRLVLNRGRWDRQQIVPEQWIDKMTEVDESEGSAWNYQYMWWRIDREDNGILASGHLGQYIYVNFEKRMIIVRLGTDTGRLEHAEWRAIIAQIRDQIPE